MRPAKRTENIGAKHAGELRFTFENRRGLLRQGARAAVVNAGLGGHVQVVAYDATKLAIELMNKGVVKPSA